MGGTFGTVITWPISGLLIESMGWDWAFYMVGLFVLIVTLIWFFVVADSPAQHRSISVKEREYIEKSLGDTITTKKVGIIYRWFCFAFHLSYNYIFH